MIMIVSIVSLYRFPLLKDSIPAKVKTTVDRKRQSAFEEMWISLRVSE